MKYWKKHTEDELKERVFSALSQNVNFLTENIVGIPVSYLDDKVFNQDASFLKEAPYISTLVKNPNHIGCHTLGESEPFFKGTQALECNVIDICGHDILKGESGGYDGYVASGGTEANMQAIWIYRNLFVKEHGATHDEIYIVCSEDGHYSMAKAANLLAINYQTVCVTPDSREILPDAVEEAIVTAQNNGAKYFIIVNNMMTTMYGSIDNIDAYTDTLEKLNCTFKIHVDGAYGGFYYPFASNDSKLTFENKHISSFTLDAHKMAQAPYGTGIFIVRKGLIGYVNTEEASYVEGQDFTMIGSRSGANAVAVWMILVKNGPYGWDEKIFILQKRTGWMCDNLASNGIEYYRHPDSNIITIPSRFIRPEVAKKFGLVPDNHKDPQWYKIVIMEHVTIEKLTLVADEIARAYQD